MVLIVTATTALVIALVFAVTSEMTLIANRIADSTTATDQAHFFALNRPYATASDAILSGMSIALNAVKISPLPSIRADC
jgi:hypothetical protein